MRQVGFNASTHFVLIAFYKAPNSQTGVLTAEPLTMKLTEMGNTSKCRKKIQKKILILMMNLVMSVEEMMTSIIFSSANIVKLLFVTPTVIIDFKVMFPLKRVGTV